MSVPPLIDRSGSYAASSDSNVAAHAASRPPRDVPISRRWAKIMLLLMIMTAALMVLCLGSGSQPLSFAAIVSAIGRTFTDGAATAGEDVDRMIVLFIRLPRILLALLVGASLAGVGVALQALLRNPLADPYVLGVSSGSALGAALALSAGLTHSFVSQVTLPIWAFLGGMTAMVIVYRLALADGRLPVHTLLLAGVIMNAVLSALILFVTSLLDPANLFRVMSWLMGNLTSPDFSTLAVLAAYSGAGLFLLFRLSRNLNIMALGEESALTLGVDVERTKRSVLLIAALLTGAAVSISGMIGFVGMIVPHMLRLLIGADHRLLLPASALVGGAFLMVSDTVARAALAPSEIPVGVVTALLGGPVFIALLTTRPAWSGR